MVLVHVSGEVDTRTAEDLDSLLHTELDSAASLRRLVVDLGGVEFMTREGLTVLLGVEKCCFARMVRLCLVACQQPVLQLLHAAGLSDHFRHCMTVAEATADVYKVDEVAELVSLLPATENLLEAIAATEPAPHPAPADHPAPVPAPLAGRRALHALYQVWDDLAEQLRPQLFPQRTDRNEPGPYLVRLREADVGVLVRALLALTCPTEGVTAVVNRLAPEHQDFDALDRLLGTLTPVDKPVAQPQP